MVNVVLCVACGGLRVYIGFEEHGGCNWIINSFINPFISSLAVSITPTNTSNRLSKPTTTHITSVDGISNIAMHSPLPFLVRVSHTLSRSQQNLLLPLPCPALLDQSMQILLIIHSYSRSAAHAATTSAIYRFVRELAGLASRDEFAS